MNVPSCQQNLRGEERRLPMRVWWFFHMPNYFPPHPHCHIQFCEMWIRLNAKKEEKKNRQVKFKCSPQISRLLRFFLTISSPSRFQPQFCEAKKKVKNCRQEIAGKMFCRLFFSRIATLNWVTLLELVKKKVTIWCGTKQATRM